MTDRLYGWTEPRALAEAAAAISEAAAVEFDLHDSDYFGGDYYLARPADGVEVRLLDNFIEDDGEPFAADFPDAAVLLSIDGELSAEFEAALARVFALKRLR